MSVVLTTSLATSVRAAAVRLQSCFLRQLAVTDHLQIEVQLAFSLWMQCDGTKRGLTGAALSEAWAQAYESGLIEARAVLSVMHRQGLRVGLAQD